MRVRRFGLLAAATMFGALVGCAEEDGAPAGDDEVAAQEAQDQGHGQAYAEASSEPDPLLGEALDDPPRDVDKGFDQPFIAMTLNVRIPEDSGERAWSVRKGMINSMVRRFGGGAGPEVLGLQELRIGTFNELHALMSHYWWFRVDRGDGGMNAIFVRTDRFEVLETGWRNTTNSERDDLCTIADDEDPLNRPIMFVRLRDRVTGRRAYFYNTHYPSKNSCERKQMSKIVSNYIAGRTDLGADVVLLGDLNDGVNGDGSINDSYSRLLNYTGLRNSYADIHPMNAASEFTSSTNGWNKALRHYRMIDHVLISGGIGVRDAYVDKTMFTSAGAIVDCPVVTNGLCGNGMAVNNLRLYSDHWAAWAILWQP